MKSKFLSLALALSALCSAVKVEAKQTTILIQQTIATNTSMETPSFLSCLKKEEQTESENGVQDNPKPTKKKRHIVGKVIIGIAIAWGVIVVVFIASYTAAQH